MSTSLFKPGDRIGVEKVTHCMGPGPRPFVATVARVTENMIWVKTPESVKRANRLKDEIFLYPEHVVKLETPDAEQTWEVIVRLEGVT